MLWSSLVAIISFGGYFLYNEVNTCCVIDGSPANVGQGEASLILFIAGIFLFGVLLQESILLKQNKQRNSTIEDPSVREEKVELPGIQVESHPYRVSPLPGHYDPRVDRDHGPDHD